MLFKSAEYQPMPICMVHDYDMSTVELYLLVPGAVKGINSFLYLNAGKMPLNLVIVFSLKKRTRFVRVLLKTAISICLTMFQFQM